MRAAFKAVQSGRQVAVLVPTTILAEQHAHVLPLRRVRARVSKPAEGDTGERAEPAQQ